MRNNQKGTGKQSGKTRNMKVLGENQDCPKGRFHSTKGKCERASEKVKTNKTNLNQESNPIPHILFIDNNITYLVPVFKELIVQCTGNEKDAGTYSKQLNITQCLGVLRE